ncbi:MAG: uroporphyrinogen-III C-methyltransferase [Gammaproteobacteria bacterium]|nr:uroporphyrinogen-III C-methyltransferase [Gammaproteobacteria bacterium]MDE2346014.1 uroporphyrinogen-III C-methyltransferase [Gammaproteobacteria bacterium]
MNAHEPTDSPGAGQNRRQDSLPGNDRHPHWSGMLALVVAVLALALVIAGWVNFERVQHRLTESLNSSLQQQTKELDVLAQAAATRSELNKDMAASQQSLKDLSDRLDSMQATLTDLRRRSEQGRDAWIKAEAASLLMAANEQVELNADPGMAIKALAAADDRLKLLSEPQLIPVRQLIAREQAALRTVPEVDITGMSATLSSLSESVPHWPLRRTVPERYEPGQHGSTPQPAQTLWQRFKSGFESIVKDIFTIHHLQKNIEPLLEPRQEYFLRQNLQLRLAAARAALLERDNDAFQNSAKLAFQWLQDYFDTRDSGVKAAIQSLAKMQQQQINPKLPDISASLRLLRETEPGGRNKAP